VERVDYDRQQHQVYVEGRQLPPETVATWMDSFARHLRPERPLAVIDLGSGTGRFTPALADTFGGPVHGVEPSARMRAIAEASSPHPAVTYVAGSAEAIPLPDASVDAVLLFLSFHHVVDKAGATREIARVLRPGAGGQVLVRSTFTDRMPDLLWHRWFPRARSVELDMFPSVDETVDLFAPTGLRPLAVERVPHRMADDVAQYAARLRLRAVSTFEHLTEDEIAEGFAAMDREVAAGTLPPGPVETDADLLVLGRLPAP
jgi:ubiquinone/menaquinone biosynthesis C-methylase UbiE